MEGVLENHDGNMLQQMNKLRKENRHCDVNFIVKGQEFPCHKLVLITASSYFETMFNGNFREADSHRNITLEDIEPEAFEEILNAIYTGRFNFNRGNTYFILRTSHMLLLTNIFNTIVSQMKSSHNFHDINYLIETCLFAQKIQHEELYSLCVRKIARSLDNLSKLDSFNEKITYDIFKAILSEHIIDESVIFQVVLRWNKYHQRSQDEILILLDLAELEHKFLSEPLMAKVIANNTKNDTDYSTRQNEKTKKSAISSSTQSGDRSNSSVKICHNVYLDVFDVKTGAKGWATLQSKDEFNQCEIIDYQDQYQLSKYSDRTVKKVGNKLYCLDYDGDCKYSFSYIEDGKRINLSPLPSNVLNGCYCYEMDVLDNCLYLVIQSNTDLQLWLYDCLMNNWFNVPFQNLPSARESLGKRLYSRSYPTPKITSYGGHLYIIVKQSSAYYSGIVRVNRRGAEFIQKIIDGPKHYYHKNPSICCYEKKLVMCGGSDRFENPEKTVVEYDMVASAWNTLNNMSIARCDHLLNHQEGFLYAVENKWTVRNEKYDISRDEWTYIPSLPERLYFAPKNVTLATSSVFSYAIERL